MNLYKVKTSNEETTGSNGSYSSIVRAKSHKDAALYLVRSEIDIICPDFEPGDDLRDHTDMADEIFAMEIPLTGEEEGYVGGDWQQFSLGALVNEIQPAQDNKVDG